MSKKNSKSSKNTEIQARIASMQAAVRVAKRAAGRSGGLLRGISERGEAPLLHSKEEVLRLEREAELFESEMQIDQIAFIALLDPATAEIADPELAHVHYLVKSTMKMVEQGEMIWRSVDLEDFSDKWRSALLQHGQFFTRWTAGLQAAIAELEHERHRR